MAPKTFASRDDSATFQARRRVSRWLDRAFTKTGFSRRAPSPPPPLPSPRPRPITPSGSLPCRRQDQSPFFSRLSPEIRQIIMLYAFGNCCMHMDLSLDYPLMERAERYFSGSKKAHAEFNLQRDRSASQQWLWRSCVCHRNAPWTPPQHIWWRMGWFKPDIDRCMEGDGFYCNSWAGDWPNKCRVGVLGWLLSCRQA